MAEESSPPSKSKIDAKEDLIFLTSGAKEKLSTTVVGASETAYKILHPFNKEAREQATEKAKTLKRDISQKQEAIRATAHEQAESDRMASLTQSVDPHKEAPLGPDPPSGSSVPEERDVGIPPHMEPSPAQPSELQNVYAGGVPHDSLSSDSSSDGSNRGGIAPASAEYRSA